MTDPDSRRRFSDEARAAVYDAIALRRDIRHFTSDPVDDAIVGRILGAAHLAPSVGFSQPWGFIAIRDHAIRSRIRASFLRCRDAEAARYPADRREQYLSYRLEGILDADLNVCVAVDLRARDEAILGTTVQPEAVRASACCAVQNLWLAARVEGIGVGWVSIVEPEVLRAELALPPGVEPIAYLCVGHPRAFTARPMLEQVGWMPRRPLADALHVDRWTDRTDAPARATSPAEPAEPANATEPPPPPRFAIEARDAALAHQQLLTKPPGALGALEAIAAWYFGVVGRFPAAPPGRPTLAIFAADHGVVREGVSAYPSTVTAAMVANIMAGGAAINSIAASCGVELVLVDVGVAGDLSAVPTTPIVPLRAAKVRAGTRDLRIEPAMQLDEAERALAVGAQTAAQLVASGADLLAAGEVGIGNTTAAAALVGALTGAAPRAIVGRGTGISEAAHARKISVVEAALARPRGDRPIEVMASLGGLELAAMTGFMLAAARARVPVVLDGFLAAAAALVAVRIAPEARDMMIAAHVSAEPGHRHALAALGLEPLLDLGMRLGEGTGAALGMHLVGTAVRTQLAMATFATAGIVGRAGARDDAP